jgi:thiol-disulfide isomerase/thioredoxin
VQLKQVKTLHGRMGGMGVQMRKDVLLMVGAPWCKWCDYMKPEFDRCALGLKHDNSVLVLYMR